MSTSVSTSEAKRSSRRRLSPEARRAELLRVALAVFAEMGIERAGHGEIARRAGVSTATVFNYFPSRGDLVEAVLSEIEGLIGGMFETAPPDAASSQDRILAIAAAYTDLVRTYPDASKTFLKWEVSFDPDVRPLYLDFQTRTLERLEAYVPDGPDRATEARILYGAANMLATMAFDGTDASVIQNYIGRIAAMIGEGE